MGRFTVFLVVVLPLLACSPSQKTPAPYLEFDPLPIADVPVVLMARAEPHVFELKNFRTEAQPIVSVLDAAGLQIAGAQAEAGVLSFSLPGEAVGEVSIIVRSAASEEEETAELWVDGELVAPALAFSSGTALRVPGPSDEYAILGVQPPNGAGHHLALLLSADGQTIVQRSAGNRTEVVHKGGGEAQVLYGSLLDGRVRNYVNDRYQDSDGDGLSDYLEQLLRTCASRGHKAPGVDCMTIADVRDTDGDGLTDGWEVLGFDAALYGIPGGEYIPLFAWGADPRHKDMFIEVDFRRLTEADNQSGLAEHMSPSVARQMAAIYADDATTDPGLRTLHAVSAANPDGRPGVSLHFDTGEVPQDPADATLYGDWGGYTAVDAIPDPMNPGAFIPQTPAVWKEQMAESRHGIFHYVLGYTTGGGSCGYGIACGFNFFSTSNSAHEFGHTLGLHHNGPYGTHEPNCKPNYPSIMNYAPVTGFSDGLDLGVLNNHALAETAALAPGHALLTRLQTDFKYKVDQATGSVDWNRDNNFAPSGTLVRAYANYKPGGQCEFTREGEQPTGMLSARSPAIVRFNGRLWVFSITLDGKLAHTYTPGPFHCANVDDCPPLHFHPAFEHDVGPLEGIDAGVMTINGRQVIILVGIRTDGTLTETWIEEVHGRFHWNGPTIVPASRAAGEPSLAVSHDGSKAVLAYRTSDGYVHYRLRSSAALQAEQNVMYNGQRLIMSTKASPALAYTYLPHPSVIAAVNQEHLVGAFIYGPVELYSFNGLNKDWTRLAVPYERMPQGSSTARAVGRPALAWVAPPVEQISDGHVRGGLFTYGRLYVVYMTEGTPAPTEPKPDPVRMSISYVDSQGKLRIGLDSFFDNVWSFAHGIDLLQPSEIGLRAAETYSIRKPAALNQVFIRPHADGISNLPYRNYDDWKVLAWGACTTLADTQLPNLKVSCAAQTW